MDTSDLQGDAGARRRTEKTHDREFLELGDEIQERPGVHHFRKTIPSPDYLQG